VIFHRWGTGGGGQLERFIVVVNFSQQQQQVGVPFPANGQWEDLLGGWRPQVAGFRHVRVRAFHRRTMRHGSRAGPVEDMPPVRPHRHVEPEMEAFAVPSATCAHRCGARRAWSATRST
jgi:hypothetical protein